MELARRNGQTLNIQHALNGGESDIPYLFKNRRTQEWLIRIYKVDGHAGNIVYQFQGNIIRDLLVIISHFVFCLFLQFQNLVSNVLCKKYYMINFLLLQTAFGTVV